MKLLIVSDMPHYQTQTGQIVGWGPTVQEIDHLATLFDEIWHVAFLYPGMPPESMLAYCSPKVTFISLRPSGGPSLWDKFEILFRASGYFATIFRFLARADVLHVRTPSSVGLLLMLSLVVLPFPKFRWFKYAGNWQPDSPDALAYRLQRFWLNLGWHRGVVTVNGSWPRQPLHVLSFLNPSLYSQSIILGQKAAAKKNLETPVQLLFVGRVETAKGTGRILEICHQLDAKGVDFELNIIGDGPERPVFEKRVQILRLFRKIRFHGWLPHTSLLPFYGRAHFILLPTTASEGWPKVLSEGMAFGAVPLAGAVSSIPQILQELKTGKALPSTDVTGFATAIQSYVAQPERWKAESLAGVSAAPSFTFDSYLARVRQMFQNEWRINLYDKDEH